MCRIRIAWQSAALALMIMFNPCILGASAVEPIRSKNVNELVRFLRGNNQENRKQALLSLQVLGADAKDAVPAIVEVLTDSDEDIRKLAFDALEAMGSSAAASLPALIKVLDGHNTTDRRGAVRVIVSMGAAAKPALPALRRAAQDQDFMLRDDASEALEKLGEAPVEAKDDQSVTTVTSSSDNPADTISYMDTVGSLLKQKWQPPKVAGSKQTVVRFSIQENGRVADVRLYRSSGDADLDSAGMKACKEVSPLPAPPKHWKTPIDIEFSFDLNVHYGRLPVTDVPAAYKDLNERLAAATNQVNGGWQALRQGDTGAALKIFDANLAKVNKQSWEASVVLAGRGMCYLLSDQPAKASPDFTRALSLLPLSEYEKIRSPNMEALVSIDYNGLFVAHLLDNQLAEAIKDDSELAKYQTDERLRMHSICGLAYGLLGRYDESIKEFDKRLQVEPGDNEARQLKATVALARDGTGAEADTARSRIKSAFDERVKRGMDKMRQHLSEAGPSPGGSGSQ